MSVRKSYEEFSEVIKTLTILGEISLATIVEASARKGMLLAAASEFEHLLCQLVREFVSKASNSDPRIVSMVEIKAISRQYHAWFDWKTPSAGIFFSLFGEEFSSSMKQRRKVDEEFSDALKAFLEIGQLRNHLVHNNYAAFYIEKTLDEMFATYESAARFINYMRSALLPEGEAAQVARVI